MKNRVVYICLLLLVVFLLSSCFAGSCSFFEFYYPVNSGDDSWEYLGKIVVTSDAPGSYFNISKKTAIITIRDRKRRKFLSETIKFLNCGGIDHYFKEVKWEKFEELELTLYEGIDKKYKNSVNGNISSEIKKYPLCKLKFEYNSKDRKFYLIEREDLGGRELEIRTGIRGTVLFN